ncbi:UNVERIFIED_CONTAM: hypothetical protein K2H54_050331 [Gekko kuhli]
MEGTMFLKPYERINNKQKKERKKAHCTNRQRALALPPYLSEAPVGQGSRPCPSPHGILDVPASQAAQPGPPIHWRPRRAKQSGVIPLPTAGSRCQQAKAATVIPGSALPLKAPADKGGRACLSLHGQAKAASLLPPCVLEALAGQGSQALASPNRARKPLPQKGGLLTFSTPPQLLDASVAQASRPCPSPLEAPMGQAGQVRPPPHPFEEGHLPGPGRVHWPSIQGEQLQSRRRDGQGAAEAQQCFGTEEDRSCVQQSDGTDF